MKGKKGSVITSSILLLAQLILGWGMVRELLVTRLIPTNYIVLMVILWIIFEVLVFSSIRTGGKLKVFLWILSFLNIIVLTVGVIVLAQVNKTMNQISVDEYDETVSMAVIVRKDDSYQTVEDLAHARVSYSEDDEYGEETIDILKKQIKKAEYSSFKDSVILARGLLNNETDAIVLNYAFVSIVGEIEGMDEFESQVRILTHIEVKAKEIVIETTSSEEEGSDDTTETRETDESGAGDSSEAETTQEPNLDWLDQYDIISSDESFVLYLSGIDTWGSVYVRQNGDVNILAVVNVKTGHVQLINTPRDYFVYMPNSGGMKDKLTHAGCYGVDISVGTLERLYGIKIDYYLKMNFSGFERIIDTLGGIDVYSEYDFTVEPIKHYVAGMNHLTGLEALAFARERKQFALGDFQRGKNQMAVINAVIKKMESSEMLYHFSDVFNSIADCVITSMPTEEIYSLAKYQLLNGVDWTVDSYTVMGTSGYSTTFTMPNYSTDVVFPNEADVETAKALIRNCINGN